MFGQLKDLYNLRKQAQELQKQMENEKVMGESSDGLVTVVINGNHDLLEVKINETQELDRKRLAEAFKQAHKKASDQMKTNLSKKFAGMM